MGLLHSKPAKPPTVPTDTIVPLHSQDDNATFRAMVLDFALCFDDVLDPEKVRGSLARLMEIGDWRKLGGRLRLNDSGKLEYHVPESFDEKRAPFQYSHTKFEMAIAEHPLASKLPRGGSRPTVLHDNAIFRDFMSGASHPTKIEDYLYSDVGQLCLHIISFTDATILSLTWPHTFLDGMGRRALFDAWLSVLNGREEDVKPLHGFNSDPLAKFGTKPTETHVLEKRQVRGFAFFIFVARMIFELVWYRKEESRVVFLPAARLNAMKATALSELSASSTEDKPFLSDGDIICAWWARLAMSVLPSNSQRTITIMNAFGLRSAVADLLPPEKAYVSNASNGVYALIPAQVLLKRPLSIPALLIRKSVLEQGTREQQEAMAALCLESFASAKRQPIFGDASTKLVVFSNWTKGKFFDLDFSAALVKEGKPLSERSNESGKPFYIHALGHSKGLPVRNCFPIYGKDAGGNYWLSGVLRTETWKKIEEEFKREL